MTNVLIAVDDDATKDTIVDFVCKHNWSENTSFRVLTVGPWMPPESQVRVSKDLQEWFESTIKSRKQLLESVAERIKASLASKLNNHFDLETTMLQGVPCELILESQESWPADLVLVGSNGRKGLDLFVLGSVSGSIAQNASCSVIVIKPEFKSSHKKAIPGVAEKSK